MMENKSFVFRFVDVEVREREFSLIKAGTVLAVEPKAFRVLLLLLRNPQKLISKEELLKAVWGDTAVTEGSLTRCIWLLRRQLGDDINEPRFIETVATVGYRFVCKVEISEDGSGDLQATGEANRVNEGDFVETPANGQIAANPLMQIDKPADHRERSRFRSWLLAGAVILIVGLATAIWNLRRPLSAPRITDYAQITRDGQRKILGGTDGARLYFTHWNTSSIGQVPIAGGQIAKIPVALQDPGLKDVSPDGSRLLIASPDGGLWSIGVLGDSINHLANGKEGAWSPDGRSVVYTDSTGDIYVVQSDGSNPYRLDASTGPSPGRLTFDLSWSPDGSRIRFTRNHALWEMSSSGSKLHELIPDWRTSIWKCCGRWTSDGEFFIFLSGNTVTRTADTWGGAAEMWAMDERQGRLLPPRAEPIPLSSGPMRWGSPIPSRDGRKIFVRGLIQRGELIRWDGQSGQMRSYLGGISAEYVAFSKDDKFVAYTSFPDGILWKSNIDGSGLVQLTQPRSIPNCFVGRQMARRSFSTILCRRDNL